LAEQPKLSNSSKRASSALHSKSDARIVPEIASSREWTANRSFSRGINRDYMGPRRALRRGSPAFWAEISSSNVLYWIMLEFDGG
jgi:hypothetical protein